MLVGYLLFLMLLYRRQEDDQESQVLCCRMNQYLLERLDASIETGLE